MCVFFAYLMCVCIILPLLISLLLLLFAVAVGGCEDLENPENGVVVTTGLSPSDTATYTCNSGYELVGTSVRTCGTDGEWSDVPPTCRRKIIFFNSVL